MAKTRFRMKTLVNIGLTERLIQLRPDTGVDRVESERKGGTPPMKIYRVFRLLVRIDIR